MLTPLPASAGPAGGALRFTAQIPAAQIEVSVTETLATVDGNLGTAYGVYAYFAAQYYGDAAPRIDLTNLTSTLVLNGTTTYEDGEHASRFLAPLLTSSTAEALTFAVLD